MAGKYLIRNWAVTTRPNDNAYAAPNEGYPCLAGYRRMEGQDISEESPVITSTIVKANGKNVVTYSGSVYILEEPDPDYLNWMSENKMAYNPDNPITYKKVIDKKLN